MVRIMARKPAELLQYSGDDISDVFEVENEHGEQTSQQKKLEDIISDLADSSDESEIRVFRQNPMGGRAPMAYLCTFPVDKFSMSQLLEHLRSKYKGGEFRIHVRVAGVLRANKLITIEEEKDTPEKSGGDTAEILKAVMDRQEKMMNVLLHRETGGNSRREFFEEMALMKQFFSAPAAPQVNFIEQLTGTLGLLKELGLNVGGGESETGFGTLLEKMAPVIQTAISQKNAPQQTEPEYKPNPTEPLKPTQNQGNIMFLKMGISTLLKAAQKKADPANYAELILDQLPAKTVVEYITSADAFAKLVEIQPLVLEYRTWFEELGEHVKAHLGLESTVSHLYDDEESAITGETLDDEHADSDDTIQPT